MPYVKGESVAARLERERQLPVEEAVEVVVQVAEALQYAHERGIVHRDVKPANILLSRGDALVADFGIALALSHAGASRLTETGLSLGTPHYMSPEQAAGERAVDSRSDVYALGCVLYEMLAGVPPFDGPNAQSIVSRLMTDPPRPVSELRRSVPRNVEAAVSKALEKLPADRFRSAEEFAHALTDRSFAWTLAPDNRTPQPGSATSRRVRAALATGFALGAAAASVVWALRSAPSSPAPATPVLSTVPLPGLCTVGRSFVISRDGSAVAVVGGGGISYRRLAEEEFRIFDTRAAAYPAFSWDGAWIAYKRNGNDSLFKVDVREGRTAFVGFASGAPSWGFDGSILVPFRDAIHRIPAGAGAADVVLTPTEDGLRYETPELLPGGKAILFTAFRDSARSAEVRLLEVATGEVRVLASPGTHPQYLPTGHVVFGHPDQALYAIPFDLSRLSATGPAVPVLDVRVGPGWETQFHAADNGTVVFTRIGSGPSDQPSAPRLAAAPPGFPLPYAPCSP